MKCEWGLFIVDRALSQPFEETRASGKLNNLTSVVVVVCVMVCRWCV